MVRAELLAKQLHSIELVNYVNSVHKRENHHLVTFSGFPPHLSQLTFLHPYIVVALFILLWL